MTPSLRAFLSGSIDYAGLFPPAKLPLADAVRTFVALKSRPESWLLDRFICPAARLDGLEAHAGLLASLAAPAALSVLTTGGEDPRAFAESLVADLEAIARLRSRFGSRVFVDALESRIPAGLLVDPDPQAIAGFVADTAAHIRSAGAPEARHFFEAAVPTHAWEAATEATVGALASMGVNPERRAFAAPERRDSAAPDRRDSAAPDRRDSAVPDRRGPRSSDRPGYKIRCGGVTAEAFPSIDQVARTLRLCRDEGVPLKATAGLHHPVRHTDRALSTKMHGFLNLIGAALLAREHGLDEASIARILADEDSGSFDFDASGFGWRKLRIDTERIEALRPVALASFGSCSFDEPVDDLTALGMLRPEGPHERRAD